MIIRREEIDLKEKAFSVVKILKDLPIYKCEATLDLARRILANQKVELTQIEEIEKNISIR